MPYSRPDMDMIRLRSEECTAAIENASSSDEAASAYLDWDQICSQFSTMNSISYIRHTINTEDEFYSAENEYWDSVSPQFSEYSQRVVKALISSKFRPELEQRFGKVMFVNNDMFLKAFDPSLIPEMQKDNSLTTEYEKLIASAQIDWNGEKLTLSQLAPYKQSPDRNVRYAAWKAESGFYKEHEAELDRIYGDLVSLRHSMALKMGYENYITLGYYNMTRNCYTREDVEKFRSAVVKYVVPAANELYRRQAKRIGAEYPLAYPDTAVSYPDGNAKPKGSADDILAAGRRFYHKLSDETAEFIDFMFDNELMDVLSRKGKAAGGYCTELPIYHSPFIFANFNGTQDDVEVITHEAGHAFAAYVNRNRKPADNMLPTIDACEIHSMTMEFFGWASSDDFFGEDADKFRCSHLAHALKSIPYVTMVDHFQHIVYEHPEYSPEKRIDEWIRLTGIYMPWIKLDGSPFYGEGRAWQRQTHIYERPFYYIDYCLAQTAALEFWTIMQTDRKDAFERYMRLVRLGGTETFDGLIAAAGLDTPFGDEALRKVTETAMQYLADKP